MKKFLFLLVIFICTFMITNKYVYADSPITILQSYEEPYVSDNSGYITVLMLRTTGYGAGQYWARTYTWQSEVGDGGAYARPYITLTDTSFKLEVKYNSSSVSGHMRLTGAVFWANDFEYYHQAPQLYSTVLNSNNNSYTISYSNPNYTIVGYLYNGSVESIDSSISGNFTTFVNSWGSESLLIAEFDELVAILTQIFNQDTEYYANAIAKLEAIIERTDKINVKLANIYDLIETELGEIYTKLSSIDNELDQIDLKIQNIIDILTEWNNTQLEQDTTPVDKGEITTTIDKEKELMGMGSMDVDSMNITIDTSANDSLWGIITQFLGANGLIMGLFVTMLSLGLVKLVLNR